METEEMKSMPTASGIEEILEVISFPETGAEDEGLEGCTEVSVDRETGEVVELPIPPGLGDCIAAHADELGRNIKADEDAIVRLKAEAEAARARVRAAEKRLEYKKGRIVDALNADGVLKAKGTYYSLTPGVSVKHAVSQEALEDAFKAKVEEAVIGVLPSFVRVKLSATYTDLAAEGSEDEVGRFSTEEKSPALRVGAPRKKA